MATRASEARDFFKKIQENEKYENSYHKNNIDKTFINYSNITFIIGGSLGLDKTILDKCNMILSFSSLTFPHQLFRLMLLEQIYRSFKILNNERYHK